MPFAEDEHVIKAFPANRTDEPLREGVLPRATRRREDLLDPHATPSVPKVLAGDGVTVAQKIGRCGVVREGVHDLLGGPVGGGVLGDVEVDDAAAMVGEHDENEEHAQSSRWHREEVNGDEICDVIGKERPPRLPTYAEEWEHPLDTHKARRPHSLE